MDDGDPPAQLRVSTWQVIDAVLDNAISNRLQGGGDDEDAEVRHAARLRERGWRANAKHPQRGLGEVGWPPDDDHLSIALSGGDREFILDRLDEAVQTAGELASSADSESERRQWEREVDILGRVGAAVRALG